MKTFKLLYQNDRGVLLKYFRILNYPPMKLVKKLKEQFENEYHLSAAQLGGIKYHLATDKMLPCSWDSFQRDGCVELLCICQFYNTLGAFYDSLYMAESGLLLAYGLTKFELLWKEQSTTTFPQLSLVISQFLSILAKIYLAELYVYQNKSQPPKPAVIWVVPPKRPQPNYKDLSEKLYERMRTVYIYYNLFLL